MSSKNTFKNKVKSTRGDVQLYTGTKQNLYKRTITIDNTSGAALTNHQINFQIDTKELYRLNKTTYNSSDFRIYDTDGVTRLDHWVEQGYNQVTSVWVKVPSIGASTTKDIYLEYGNSELTNLSDIDLVFDSVFSKVGQKSWYKANDIHKDWEADDYDGSQIAEWNSVHNPEEYLSTNNYLTSLGLIYNKNKVNNLPAITFDDSNNGSLRGYAPFNYDKVSQIQAGLDYDIFIVERRDSGKTNNYLVTQDAAESGTNSRLLIGYASSTIFRFSQFGNDLDYTVSSYTTPTWRCWECVLDRFNNSGLGGAGHYIRLNGASASNNSNTDPLLNTAKLLLSRDLASNFYSGDVAEILILPLLNSTERTLVERYFAGKYRFFGSEPTTTVGAETEITQIDSYISYLPAVINFDIDQKIKPAKTKRGDTKQGFFGVVQTTIDVEMQNIFNQVILAGNEVENWTISTDDFTNKLNGRIARARIATTTGGTDTCTIDRPERSDLSQFNIINDVVTTTYSSTDDDYILADFYFEDHETINKTLSFISFENTASTLIYRSNLVNNINNFASQNKITVKIKKSDFIKTGTGDWSDIDKMLVNVRTTTGSQSVYYNNFRLSINSDRLFNVGDQVRLGLHVSDDNFLTNYFEPIQEGVITKTATTQSGWKFEVSNRLELFKSSKWTDISSFPYFNWIYKNIQPNNNLLVQNSEAYNLNEGWNYGANIVKNGEIADQNGEFKKYAYSFTQTSTFSDIVSDIGFFPIVESVDYTFSIWIKRQGAISSGTDIVDIEWFDNSFVSISNDTSLSFGVTESWAKYEFTATSPVGAKYARITLPSNVNGTIDFSSPQFEQNSTSTAFENYNDQGLAEFAKKAFGFFFKNSDFNFNLGVFSQPFNLQKNLLPLFYLQFQKNEVIDFLEKYVTACLGIISYDSSNKLTIQSGDVIWDSSLNFIDVLENQIIDFEVIYSDIDIVNSITIQPKRPTRLGRLFRFADSNGDNTNVAPFQEQAFKFEARKRTELTGETQIIPFGQNIRIGANFVSNVSAVSFNNSNVSLINKELVDSELLVRFANNGGANRYLWHLEASTWSLAYTDSAEQNKSNFKNIKNFYSIPEINIQVQGNAIDGIANAPGDIIRFGYEPSINSITRKNITIANEIVEIGSSRPYSEGLLPILRGLNSKPVKYRLETIYLSELAIGKQIKFLDPYNNYVQAVILEISTFFVSGKAPKQKIICQRIA